jgi:transposase
VAREQLRRSSHGGAPTYTAGLPLQWSEPANLPAHLRSHRELLARCPESSATAQQISQRAHRPPGDHLDAWMAAVDVDDLPALYGFVHGLRRDLDAVVAGLSRPYSNGP